MTQLAAKFSRRHLTIVGVTLFLAAPIILFYAPERYRNGIKEYTGNLATEIGIGTGGKMVWDYIRKPHAPIVK